MGKPGFYSLSDQESSFISKHTFMVMQCFISCLGIRIQGQKAVSVQKGRHADTLRIPEHLTRFDPQNNPRKQVRQVSSLFIYMKSEAQNKLNDSSKTTCSPTEPLPSSFRHNPQKTSVQLTTHYLGNSGQGKPQLAILRLGILKR